MTTKAARLESVIRELTRPVSGQYPRPWLTTLDDPSTARVFTVGRNQRRGIPVDAVPSHDAYLDALFNRGPETCRQLYDRLNPEPSPTRVNTDRLVRLLGEVGVSSVLETNVVCYATPMSSDLTSREHRSGAGQGRELFRALLDVIGPEVIIVHGAGAAKELGRVLDVDLPAPPSMLEDRPRPTSCRGVAVFVIPSLAPPRFTKWVRWSEDQIRRVAKACAGLLN
jgi:hypothetical protein